VDAPFSGASDDVSARFHDHFLQGIHKLAPVPLRAAMLEPFGPTHFVDRSMGLPRRLSNTFRVKDSAILRSASDVRSALFKTTITSCTWRPTSSTSVSFFSCDRGIGADNHKRGIDVGINAWVAAVLPATRNRARGCPRNTCQWPEEGWYEDFHPSHALGIFRIVFLRDKLLQFFRPDVQPVSARNAPAHSSFSQTGRLSGRR